MITAIVNQKGGVAKTTTTHALASAMALKGKKVLMIDLDSQASLSICCGLQPHKLPCNVYDVLTKKIDAEDCVYKTKLENLYIIPSGSNLALADMQLMSEIGRETVLKRMISKIKVEYDCIFIDCAPSLSVLVLNALVAADRVIIPCSPDFLAYQGLKLLLHTIEQVKVELNPPLKVLGVIITMSDKRTNHTKEIRGLIVKCSDVLGEVGFSVKAKDSIAEGLSIVVTEPMHPIALDYSAIATSIGG